MLVSSLFSRRIFLKKLLLGVGVFTTGSSVIPYLSGKKVFAQSFLALENNIEPPMILIEGGEYTIGADDGSSASPSHTVVLEPFYIDAFEVSNEQFAMFLNTLGITLLQDAPAGQVTASSFADGEAVRFIEGGEGDEDASLIIALDDSHCRIGIRDGQFVADENFFNHPVAETTWQGANLYAAWRGARLPTEVEWEAAARSMSGRIYPWGDAEPTQDYAVIGRGSGETASVGTHPLGATPEGLYDMAGNLAEWTSSLYLPYPYNAEDGREDPTVFDDRVTRGGDHVYDSSGAQLTTYFRDGFSRAPGRGHRHIGFRCARSVNATSTLIR